MFAFDPYDMDALLPAHMAAEMCNVSRQLFSWWVRTGKIEPVARRGRTPLYRLGDAFDVEAQTRQSAQSRRKVGATA
jgi:predicted site-specific integrase-resolvase